MAFSSQFFRLYVAVFVSLLLLLVYHFSYQPLNELPEKFRLRKDEPQWLIATMTPAHNLQRRAIIRSTWQKLYRNDKLYTTRFVISGSKEIWNPVLKAENETYGDLIQLPWLEESGHVANTIKSVEFFKYIAETQPNRYAFVSKIDDDSFLDAKGFYSTYLQPRLTKAKAGDLTAVNRTAFGRTLHKNGFQYPGGQFYTLSDDLVRLYADLYTANPINDEDEDVLIGRLLHESHYEAGHDWQHIDLPNEIAFDYEGIDTTSKDSAHAKSSADLSGWRHAVGPKSICPHKMRTDQDYLKVAACFNEEGVIP